MTPHQKLQAIIEATPGMCWHEEYEWRPVYDAEFRFCVDCGASASSFPNPSPDDMNALLKIAEKLVWRHTSNYNRGAIKNPYNTRVWLDAYTLDRASVYAHADTPAAALLDALWQAVKGGK